MIRSMPLARRVALARPIARACAATLTSNTAGGTRVRSVAAAATAIPATLAARSACVRRAFSTGGSASACSSSAPALPSTSLCAVVPVGSKGPPGSVVRVVARSLAPKPLSHQVLVRVEAAAINPIDNMMCAGYGRELITLAQRLGSSHADDCAPAAADEDDDAAAAAEGLTLGREGVGSIVALGDSVWGSASASSGSLRVGDRVWFSPRIIDNSGALSEHCALGLGELSRAPANLPDPEAAAFPFAVCTAWTALVDCAGIRPRALPVAARKFAPGLRGGQPAEPASALNVLSNVGLDPRKITGALQNLSTLPGVSALASRVCPLTLRDDAPRRAVVHGASGPVGLAAVQLLQLWGFDVWATTIAATRGSLDTLATKQAAETERRAADPDAPVLGALHIVDTASESLSSLPVRSFAVVLDGVGGEEVMEQALQLLAPSGQIVTLRGEGVKAVDRDGLLQGTIKGGASYAQCKSRAAEFGCGYHWAISTPSSSALEYVGALISSAQWHTNLLPIALWRGGLAQAAAALQAAEDEAKQSAKQRPRHVVIIHKSDENKQ